MVSKKQRQGHVGHCIKSTHRQTTPKTNTNCKQSSHQMVQKPRKWNLPSSPSSAGGAVGTSSSSVSTFHLHRSCHHHEHHYSHHHHHDHRNHVHDHRDHHSRHHCKTRRRQPRSSPRQSQHQPTARHNPHSGISEEVWNSLITFDYNPRSQWSKTASLSGARLKSRLGMITKFCLEIFWTYNCPLSTYHQVVNKIKIVQVGKNCWWK